MVFEIRKKIKEMKGEGLKQLNEIIAEIVLDDEFLYNLVISKHKKFYFYSKIKSEKQNKIINIYLGKKIIIETDYGKLKFIYNGTDIFFGNINNVFCVKRIKE